MRKTTDYHSWFHNNHSAVFCSHLLSTWFHILMHSYFIRWLQKFYQITIIRCNPFQSLFPKKHWKTVEIGVSDRFSATVNGLTRSQQCKFSHQFEVINLMIWFLRFFRKYFIFICLHQGGENSEAYTLNEWHLGTLTS